MASAAANASKRSSTAQAFANATNEANEKTRWQRFAESKPVQGMINGAKRFGKFMAEKACNFGSDMKAGAKAFAANFSARRAEKRAGKYIDKLKAMGYGASPEGVINNWKEQNDKLQADYDKLKNDYDKFQKTVYMYNLFGQQPASNSQQSAPNNQQSAPNGQQPVQQPAQVATNMPLTAQSAPNGQSPVAQSAQQPVLSDEDYEMLLDDEMSVTESIQNNTEDFAEKGKDSKTIQYMQYLEGSRLDDIFDRMKNVIETFDDRYMTTIKGSKNISAETIEKYNKDLVKALENVVKEARQELVQTTNEVKERESKGRNTPAYASGEPATVYQTEQADSAEPEMGG